MLVVLRPTTERLQRRLAEAAAATPDIGGVPSGVAADGAPAPAGQRRFEAVAELGADADADALVAALLRWDVHRAAGIVVAADGPAAVGTTLIAATRVGPIGLPAPTRVTAVLDEPGRRGLVYATLPGHPVVGEELFAVEQDVATGAVRFRLRSHSRPHGLPALFPPAARAAQRVLNGRYLEAARRLAAG